MFISRAISALLLAFPFYPAVAAEPVNSQTITGVWQATTLIENGKSVPYGTPTEDNGLPYKVQRRFQMQFSGDKVRFIGANDVGITNDSTTDYRLEGDILIPTSTGSDHYSPIKIISLTKDFMTLQGTEGKEQNQQLEMKKVSENELLTNVIKPITEAMHFKVKYGDTEISQDYSAPFEKTPDQDMEPTFVCLWFTKRPMNLSITMQTSRMENGQVTLSTRDPNLTLISSAQFNWSLKKEEMDTVVSSTSSEFDLKGTLPNHNELSFAKGGGCQIHLMREGRLLHYTGACAPLRIHFPQKIFNETSEAVMTLNGNCVLNLQKE